MSDLRRFTWRGEKKKGMQNRFYDVEARELEDRRGEWIFRWGRIGTNGQFVSESTYSFKSAKDRCNMQIRKKGDYTEVNAMEALASAVQDLDERPSNGFEAVEIEVPCFHAGRSEKRCQDFCAKYLAKLNVVRRSRWDLLAKEYEQQMEQILKSYCSEWSRITRTNAHGHLEDNAASLAAFRIFFGDLRDNTKCTVHGYFKGVGTV